MKKIFITLILVLCLLVNTSYALTGEQAETYVGKHVTAIRRHLDMFNPSITLTGYVIAVGNMGKNTSQIIILATDGKTYRFYCQNISYITKIDINQMIIKQLEMLNKMLEGFGEINEDR